MTRPTGARRASAGPGTATEGKKATVPAESEVRTMQDAHDFMARLRPASVAPAAEWLAFRRRGAQVYARVADVDRYHHHEALYWAQLEHEAAEELAGRIAAERSKGRPAVDHRK